MTAGLEVFDAAGLSILTVTDSLVRIMGEFNTGTSPGSFVVPGAGTGQIFFFQINTGDSRFMYRPEVVRSGDSIVWSFNSASDYPNRPRASATITYGRY